MNCPYCEFHFGALAANGEIPAIAPLICENCGEVGLLENGCLRRVSREELAEIKKSPAWDFLAKAQDAIRRVKEMLSPKPPVDRTQRVMTDGSPETPDHREINPVTGQQKGYVVLTPEERARGYVRPVRQVYLHKNCGTTTRMAWAIAETYARDPKFYTGTFCVHCREHRPLTEFVWDGTNEQVGS